MHEDRAVLQQPLVDRPKLLHVERRIVDPDQLVRVGMAVEVERTQATKQHIVAQRAAPQHADGVRAEQLAGQRCQAQLRTRPVGLKELEGGQQRQPQVVLAPVFQIALLGKAAQTLHAVILVVDRTLPGTGLGRRDEVARLGHHQEEQAIDQAQQLLVIRVRLECA